MRAFLIACTVVAVVAIGAEFTLDHFVQQSVAAAFSTSAVRR